MDLSYSHSRSPATLYTSPNKSIILIDIPLFLSRAQTLPPQNLPPQTHPSQPPKIQKQILSFPPPLAPYPSTEPKSAKAKARVLERVPPETQALDAEYRALIRAGLAEIRSSYGGPWCLPRVFGAEEDRKEGREERKRKRKRQDGEWNGDGEVGRAELHEGNVGKEEPSLTPLPMPRTAKPWPTSTSKSTSTIPLPLSPSPAPNILPFSTIANRTLRNPSDQPATLTILLPSSDDSHSSYSYFIPPHSAFALSQITPSTAVTLAASLHQLWRTPTRTAAPGQADIVLLDPPWRNRSVRRGERYVTLRHAATPTSASTFTQAESHVRDNDDEDYESEDDDALHALQSALHPHLAPGAMVAVWTTHASSCRARVKALFEAWDVQAVEEWVWLKVTSASEPVYDLDGVWRRSWEVLVVGRRRGNEGLGGKKGGDGGEGEGLGGEGVGGRMEGVGGGDGDKSGGKVRRRLIVAVPDVHSRKPFVGGLLKELVLGAAGAGGGGGSGREMSEGEAESAGERGLEGEVDEVRALEVFARNTAAGWCSWGDEVLRFNWEGHWSEGREED